MARGGRQIIPRPDAWRLGDPAPWLGAEPVGVVVRLHDAGKIATTSSHVLVVFTWTSPRNGIVTL
jgi:hypothetical protein